MSKLISLSAERVLREAEENFTYCRNYNKALALVTKAISFDPQRAKAWILKGEIFFCMDRVEEAIDCFDKAIALVPENVEAYISKANILDVIGRERDALESCNIALTKAKSKYNQALLSIYDQKINLLIRLKKYDAARDALSFSAHCLDSCDYSYLRSCYEHVIMMSCKERSRKLKLARMLSMKIV